MNHILRPGGSTLPHIEVPYVCQDQPHNVASFYTAHDLLAGAFNDPLTIFACKVQTALYFGLLSAFIGEDIPSSFVVRENEASNRLLHHPIDAEAVEDGEIQMEHRSSLLSK